MTNYSQALGIHNKWAPIVFAVIYFFIFLYYVTQAIRRHAIIYGALAFFSLLRIISFSLRAAMANSPNDASNKGIAIAYEVLYSVGFFSILFSVYRLLQDRERLAKINRIGNRVTSALHKGRLVHFLLFLAVVLGVVGIVLAMGTYGHNGVGNSLNKASTYIFLAVSLIILLLTLFVIHLERKFRGTSAHTGQSAIGQSHHHLILTIVALLLVLRTIYYTVTVHQRLRGNSTSVSSLSTGKQSNEKLWYPLAALAELLAALAFLVPGLVPLRSMVRNHRAAQGEKAGYAGQAGNGNMNGNVNGNGYSNDV